MKGGLYTTTGSDPAQWLDWRFWGIAKALARVKLALKKCHDHWCSAATLIH